MFVDTHFHYDGDEKDIDYKIKEEAKENHVYKMILSGYNLKSSKKAVLIAQQHQEIYATVGFHPEEASYIQQGDWEELKELISNDNVVAVGEIGLDYYYDDSNKEEQKNVFIRQLELALTYKKPVVIHSRNAALDVYDILHKHNIKGVIHCFSDDYEMANKFIELGFYIGIGGVVTFKNAKDLYDVVKRIPIDHILLETDSPYLAPVPYRGKENSPKNIKVIAEKIAEIKGMSLEEVGEITTANAKRLFDL